MSFASAFIMGKLKGGSGGGGGGGGGETYKKLTGIVLAAKTYYLVSGFKLKGSDTVRISASVTKACNVFGCYTTTSATDNYSLYFSTTSGSKYLRYNGGTYKSYIANNQLETQFDMVITPTGSSGMPQNDTWSEANFTASVDMCIGTTSPEATSSKLDGTIYGPIIVDGRLYAIPVERQSDGKIGYYEVYSDRFLEPIGDNPTKLAYA